MLDLNELCKVAYKNTCKRAEHEPDIKMGTMEALKHCAGEVIEATEAYSRVATVYSISEVYSIAEACKIHVQNRENFISELADIICCVLTICGKENIDIEYALTMCMEKNADRAELGGK